MPTGSKNTIMVGPDWSLKRNISSNYVLMMILPMIWIIQPLRIEKKYITRLNAMNYFQKKQKGCCKGTRWTNDFLYIDHHIIKEVKTRRKKVSITWIDCKKTYDMFPETFKISRMSENAWDIRPNHKLHHKCQRKLELAAGGQSLAELKIQRDISRLTHSWHIYLLLLWCHWSIYLGNIKEDTNL